MANQGEWAATCASHELKVKIISWHRLYVSSLPLLNSGNKCCTCVTRSGRGHTVSAEPGGYTRCFFNFFFLFVPCGGLSFLLHVKYTISYRIVSCCKTGKDTAYANKIVNPAIWMNIGGRGDIADIIVWQIWCQCTFSLRHQFKVINFVGRIPRAWVDRQR